ncbi:hypothetical protein CKO_03704 [Citrobacter koseri ATCC BAA-895]|uniref:Uncharacterized protein n=1 Tax=Citrobacter koseri (strain ATCC BAA-895 / CDC 4225-83 / SGSC4696) TaxID=290338 RepID=A8AMR7_CITK8|nr:hypothetical protein CKO_03704 [Citrobacter koseri ATCC BAA-895]
MRCIVISRGYFTLSHSSFLPGLQVFFSLYMSFNLSRFDIYH